VVLVSWAIRADKGGYGYNPALNYLARRHAD
jgi:hypothetical protein